MKFALLCVDFIFEIVHPQGKLAKKGYSTFVERHDSLAHLASLQAEHRKAGGRVIHCCLGFTADYADHPGQSMLLGGARAAGILQAGTKSTEILEAVAPQAGDIVMRKSRISAFHGTPLELTLRSLGITEITIAGVATDLAVQSAARAAHDLDFGVKVAADACAAATDEDHQSAIRNMAKFASII